MIRSLPYLLALSGLLVSVAGVAVFHIYGTPHLALEYSFLDNGDPWNPAAPRYYTSCTYFGLNGAHKVAAQGGDCPWVMSFRSERAR